MPDPLLSTGNIYCLTQQAQPWGAETADIPMLLMRKHSELGIGIPTLPKRKHSEVLSVLSRDREKVSEAELKTFLPGSSASFLHHLLPFQYPTHEHDDTEHPIPET